VAEDPALDLALQGFAGKIERDDDKIAAYLALPGPIGFGDTVRYDHSRSQWHIWDGTIWKPDRTREVYDITRRRIIDWIGSDALTNDDRKALLPVLNVGKKEGVLKALSSFRGIAMKGDEWDPDPTLMAFTNGVLNLRTGVLSPGDPADLVSRTTGLRYNPEADFEPFLSFVRGIMGNDEDLATYLVSVLGYAIIGWQREQKFWMFVGKGQNGKGVLARTVTKGLGTYASSPPDTLYMKTRQGAASSDKPRPELLRLSGVRFTAMSEPQGGQFNEEMIKAHTGNDPVEARDLYAGKNGIVKFLPTHTIFFLTNDPPRTDDVGPSMQRRVRIIMFEQDYRGERKDDSVEDRLQEDRHLEGMLLILTAAAKRYIEMVDARSPEPIAEPAKVTAWSQSYIEENDPLSAFIETACVVGSKERGSAALLWAAYQDWAARSGVESAGSQMGFGLALSRRFSKGRSGANAVVYEGIRAKSVVELASETDG
jgi:putative DNA primase/helicase